MKLSQVKSALSQLDHISFQLPDGSLVPSHFHVTEVGKITKEFIDCGGTRRREEVVSLQLWDANDYDHRLHPEKLLDIITLSERALSLGDLEIEVEYQGTSIAKYGLDFTNSQFRLTTKYTDCLAREGCGVPANVQQMVSLKQSSGGACSPGGGCC